MWRGRIVPSSLDVVAWQTLHDGDSSEARRAAGFLDGFGIPLRVVDEAGVEFAREKLAYTGSPVRLQVREEDLPAAVEILADSPSAPSPSAAAKALDRLGLTIRACAVSPFAPLGILLAPSYLMRSARETIRPREHAWTLAGIAACVPASLFYAFAFYSMFLS